MIAQTVLVASASVILSGRPQNVELYRVSPPQSIVVLSSGDLGWVGFVVDVAEFLHSKGVAVLGFNTRRYLESFTRENETLDPAQIPRDYKTLAEQARELLGAEGRPVLVGISEGAGLSVIAASAPEARDDFQGVVCLGLPDTVELGWRAWRDWTIWFTKKEPNEPHVELVDYIGRARPVPLVILQSTRDEFVPLETAKSLFAAAGEPKRIHFIEARNHRFSDKREELHARLLDSLTWIAGAAR